MPRALVFRALARRWGCLTLLFAAALLSGCSTTRLYNNADRLLAWRADSLLGLSAEQRGAFRDDLGPVLAWHRQSQLPRWADALERLALAVEDDAVSPAFVEKQKRTFGPMSPNSPSLSPPPWPCFVASMMSRWWRFPGASPRRMRTSTKITMGWPWRLSVPNGRVRWRTG